MLLLATQLLPQAAGVCQGFAGLLFSILNLKLRGRQDEILVATIQQLPELHGNIWNALIVR